MTMKRTLGGQRLGSGNKMQVEMKTYERSTHDLGYIWRSTMAAGTLVPFLTEVGLPGDTFDIDLDCNIMTHPTVGPLFGSYKVQLDVFMTPIRLYQRLLHNNALGIGLQMGSILLPQIRIEAEAWANGSGVENNEQINPSSILSYLNIRGIGKGTTDTVVRNFNAVPYLAYWDIYKNYYANKQEEIGAVIHSAMNPWMNNVDNVSASAIPLGTGPWIIPQLPTVTTSMEWVNQGTYPSISFNYPVLDAPTNEYGLWIRIEKEGDPLTYEMAASDIFGNVNLTTPGTIYFANPVVDYTFRILGWRYATNAELKDVPPKVHTFNLGNIDEMRETILSDTSAPFLITRTTSPEPYSLPLKYTGTEIDGNRVWSKNAALEGLAIKTYQSDLFNNWIQTEWLDGTNGINEITSIDTTSGSFSIDTLNLSKKVYDMLNRIAISGGTYDDWLDTVYTHDRYRSAETPMYMGGLIKELVFQEVVSNSDSGEQPLGTLAGKGVMSKKHKGGKITVRVDEPSYIMGIISLTPRVDYSQGNKWDVNLKSMDDLHKPALDEIGFQDLITDQMAWWDTDIDAITGVDFKSAGKQPAWLNYMTNVNQVRGNFAIPGNEMFMTLNRQYEYDPSTLSIKDLTTYIDPAKYNNIFAQTARDAQNFWTQIGCNITARRKMSARIIPNL